MAAQRRDVRDQVGTLASSIFDQLLELQGLAAAQQSELEQLRAARRALLTYTEACAALAIKDDKLRSLIAAGELPVVELGDHSPRIDPVDLDALIANLKVIRRTRPALHAVARLRR